MTTQTKSITTEILGCEFTTDELKDIVNHGMAGGVSGFIYSTELAEKYNAYEDQILDALDELANELGEASGLALVVSAVTGNDEDCFYSMQNIKEYAVWMYVEMIAQNVYEAMDPDA